MGRTGGINPTMGPLEWALLLTLSVLWGGSFFFVEVAVTALPPLTVVALRVGLAAIALNLAMPLLGLRMPLAPRVWLAFLAMGAVNNLIPFSLIAWGQTQIAGGLAAILNATTPLFTVLVAHALTADEKASPPRLAGVVVGLAGITAMVGVDALAGLGGAVVAQAAVLAASLSYAFGGVYGRRFRRMGVSPLATATGQLTASAAMAVPLALAVDRPWGLAVPTAEVWAAVAGFALLSTALAYILYFRILATAGATNLLLVTFLIPVTAILLGALVLGERLEPRNFGGMAVIALGLALIDGRPIRWARVAVRGAAAAKGGDDAAA